MRAAAFIVSMLFVLGPLLLLAPVQPANGAPIYVSGDIYSIDSWSLATSPVLIIGNVTVHEGAVLNIKEGTEVRFDEGTHLNVEGGTLNIAGTPASPVRFLPNSSSPYKGSYEWIYVNSTPMYPAVLNADWAYFSYGVKGFYLDGVRGAAITNVNFDLNTEAGIYLSHCTGAQVRNCTFRDCDGWGVLAEYSDNLTITECYFYGCGASSVLFSDCQHSSFTGAFVNGTSSDKGVHLLNSQRILLDTLTVSGAVTGLELELSGNNTVFGSRFTTLSIGVSLNRSADNLFRGNNFTDCDLPLSLAGDLEICQNTFEKDNYVGGYPVYFLNSGNLDGVKAGAVVLANCAGSTVSNITFPPKGGTLIAFLGGGNTIRDTAIAGAYRGVLVAGSQAITLVNLTVTGAAAAGIELWRTDGLGISDSSIEGCAVGMAFAGPMNISVARVRFAGNQEDLVLKEGGSVRCLDCVFESANLDDTSRLVEDHTLTVLVRDNASLPLSGAEVRVTSSADKKYASSHFGGTDPATDNAGRIGPLELTSLIRARPTWTYVDTTIEVWHGDQAFDRNPRTLGLTAATEEIFSVLEGGILAGMVRDLSGDPVMNVKLLLDNGMNVSTGPDGQYKFPPLAPGTYALNASLLGWQAQSRTGLVVPFGQTTYVNLTFDPSPGFIGEVRGVVRNQTGGPLYAAFINIGGGKTTDTNESGVFRILSAPAGWVNITVSKAGYIDSRTRAFVPPDGVSRWANVTLLSSLPADTGIVLGTVLSNGVTPLSGATVRVEDIPSITNLTDSSGLFRLEGIPPGTHNISASADYHVTVSVSVDVVANVAKSMNIVLYQETMAPAWLSGQVTDKRMTPVSGATVRIDGTARMAGTGPDGRYQFDNVQPGNYSVTATAPRLGSTTETNVNIPLHSGVQLNIILGPDRTFTNTSLGVSVSGDFSGDGSMVIQEGREPPVLPPGELDRFFEITDHGFTCLTKVFIVVTGQPFRDALAGLDLSKVVVKLYTHPSGSWGSGDRWEVMDDSGYDEEGGFFWANGSHLSIFGIGVSSKGGPGGPGTIVALPPWLPPIALVAIVLLVGVPIGIIVIRIRQPPAGGKRQEPPRPPENQSGTNLYP